jgi:hypothetical protein
MESLTQESGFKFYCPNLLVGALVDPQELQNVLNPSESVALIGRKMTERFLEKQTANFYCFFYSWRPPGNKSGKFIPGFCRKTIKLTKNNKLEKPYEEIRPSSLSQFYSEIYCGSSYVALGNNM